MPARDGSLHPSLITLLPGPWHSSPLSARARVPHYALPNPVKRIRIIGVGQNRIYTYIYTVVISKPKTPNVHRLYMVLANPNYH